MITNSEKARKKEEMQRKDGNDAIKDGMQIKHV